MSITLELAEVSARYPGSQREALAAISFRFDAACPSIIAVVGESGSGKTTLAQIALGLLTPTTGMVRFEGTDVERLGTPERKRFRRSVQAILQDPFSSFNPFYKVDQALCMPLLRFGIAVSKSHARELMEVACRQVGLNPSDTLGRYPHQLSGGQRQRLMVARALMLKPQVIVADEPVSMVDASLRATILDNVASLRRDHGISVLYITHDLTTAYHVADSVLVLYQGKLVEAGDVHAVLRAPKHPYTQLLMDSIPLPDVDRTWGQIPIIASAQASTTRGCPFEPRCANREPACMGTVPSLGSVSKDQSVACLRVAGTPLAEGSRAVQ